METGMAPNVNDPRGARALESMRNILGRASDSYLARVHQGGLGVAKAGTSTKWDLGLGLQARSLRAPALLTYPIAAPFLKVCPREQMNPVSHLAEWKKITQVDSNYVDVSVAEDGTGNEFDVTTQDLFGTIKQLALLQKVGWSAQLEGKDFMDAKATAALTLLQKFREGEEDVVLGGNGTTALVKPGAPSGVSALGGSLATGVYTLKATALTARGKRLAQKATYDPSVITGQTELSNASGAVTLAIGSEKITWSWPGTPGAWGYNVFIDKDGGGYKFQGTVFMNKWVELTYNAAGGATPASNGTVIATQFEGLFTQLLTSGDAGFLSMDGAALTGDSAGGITQLTQLFESAFRRWYVGPNEIWGSGSSIECLTKKVAYNSSAPAYRINIEGGETNIEGGIKIGSILNRFTGDHVKLFSHPRLPDGRLYGIRRDNPYDYSNMGRCFQVLTAVDYYQVEYAVTASEGRVWPVGIYAHEIMQLFFGGGGFILQDFDPTA